MAVKPRMSVNMTTTGSRVPPGSTWWVVAAIRSAICGVKYRSKFSRTRAARESCSAAVSRSTAAAAMAAKATSSARSSSSNTARSRR